MKLKMPCKLCEIDHQKLGASNCTHTPFGLPQFPTMMPFNVDLGHLQNSAAFMPQLRDMMLAYLFRGYYQPAGPLINVPHGHTQPPPTLGKSAPLSETSSVSPPPTQPPPAPSSGGDSSDNDVIITSVTNAKDASPPQQPYRLGQYPTSAHSTYPYGYPTHYYHAPHPTPPYPHHDLCYSPNTYLHKSYPPYRRYLTVGPPPNAQYFQPSPPDLYNPPPAPPPPATQQNQQVVTATSSAAGSANSYQAPPNGPPPAPPTILESYPPQQPPTLVESYPPPYYAGYGPPPPPCYSHSPTRSSLPYINATYQNCPCPIQSCPKNVHTGPLIGNNKRSNISSITKDSILLQPVALALPMEPASATGPPSPARGSAGMPPPPSPAGATYQAPPTPKRETPEPADLKSIEKRRKPARVGKSAVRETLHQNTMLLMCQEQEPPTSYLNGVKREVESPKEDSKKEIIPHEVVSKVEATNVEEKVAKVTIMIQEAKIETLIEPEKPVQCLKEEKVDVVSVVKDVASPQVPPQAPPVVEQLEPCVKTVAENVKVKNMKRKPSITKEEPSPKKQKIEKSSGSYKDLIRKNYAAVQITNGKRKLLSRSILQNSPKIRFKKPQTKRKHSPVKEVETKKLKPSKPLTACNHNSKLTMKEKEKAYVEADLIENKEPSKKIGKKTLNTKCKKIAPAALDNLISMNSVDRTIESVISENNNTTRTLKNGTNATTLRTFGGKFNSKVKPEIKKEHNNVNKKSSGNSNNNNNVNAKIISIRNNKFSECKKIGAAKRKTKCKSADMTPQIISRVPRKSLLLPRWSNGWEWKGEPFEGKVFLNSDEATVIRKCYPAMIHSEGDIIAPRDSVLLKAGPRKNDLPFVARIAALWENPEDGEMMMSLLWYYRPEHTEQGRLPTDQRDEVFASRHKDSNSVACIEDKCYVLTYNEYCRLRKNFRKVKEEAEERLPSIPLTEIYNGLHRQPPMTAVTPPEMIFFCRRVYDFRQKRIVKNPS